MTLHTTNYHRVDPATKDPIVLKLFEILEGRHITYKSFSRAIHVDVETLRRWKRGRTHPNTKDLARALEVLGYELRVVAL